MKKLIWIAVILALVGGGRWYWLKRHAAAPAMPAGATGKSGGPGGFGGPGGGAMPVAVRTEPVEVAEWAKQLDLTGPLHPIKDVEVSPQLSGLLSAFDIQLGQSVERGAVLGRIKDDEIGYQLKESMALLQIQQSQVDKMRAGYEPDEIRQAQADVDEKKSLFDKARFDWDRQRRLAEKNLISQSDSESARSAYEAAQSQHEKAQAALARMQSGYRKEDIAAANAQLDAARARVDALQDRLDKTSIAAPIGGLIASKLAESGEWVTAGKPILRIVALDKLKARVAIPESEILDVRPGRKADLTVDALPGRVFEGEVVEVSPRADPVSRAFEAYVQVSNPKRELKAEMYARVRIPLSALQTVTLVPRDAVTRYAGEEGVFAVRDGKLAWVAGVVSKGPAGKVIFAGAVLAGEPVVVSGTDNARPGAPAIPTDGAPPAAPAAK